MRPRPDAAENDLAAIIATARAPRRFNEAAARCRGKRPLGPVSPSSYIGCFNEAAARCRGKRQPAAGGHGRTDGFNEAAARCRGKLSLGSSADRVTTAASMRPRPDAAENALRRGRGVVNADPLQ